MRETIHQIATTGIDIFVLILLAMAGLWVLIYVGWFIYQFLFMLIGESRK